MWNITRTKPNGEHVGKAVPVFINNLRQHYATIKAYADGAVDVWGFLDLDLFDRKLQTGWVSTAPPVGSRLSIFNLGVATVSKGDWRRSLNEVRDVVWSVVREFDPLLTNVIDMEGSDTRLEGKVRYAKLGLSDDCPYRIDENGNKILGKEIPLFECDGRDSVLKQWFIYSDGTSRVGFDGELTSLGFVYGQIDNGSLTTCVNDAGWIEIPTLGKFIPTDGHWGVSAEQRIVEAKDIMSTLQGGEGAIQLCIAAHGQYEKSPNSENKKALKDAYDAVPDHLKMYCGDMDSKDWPIRRILYPDDGG